MFLSMSKILKVQTKAKNEALEEGKTHFESSGISQYEARRHCGLFIQSQECEEMSHAAFGEYKDI